MRRSLITLALLLVAGAAGWTLWDWFSVSPAARTAKPYAQKFVEQIKNDPRFGNIRVRVWELGDKGPIYVSGTVASDSDRTDLHQRFEALHCPVGSDWDVFVHANDIGTVRTN